MKQTTAARRMKLPLLRMNRWKNASSRQWFSFSLNQNVVNGIILHYKVPTVINSSHGTHDNILKQSQKEYNKTNLRLPNF